MRYLALIIICLMPFCVFASNTSGETSYCLMPKKIFHPHERVTQIKIHVTSGKIRSLKDMPMGWYFTIDNDPSWNTDLEGKIIVGSAALYLEDLLPLICISSVDLTGLQFDVSIEIATTEDFENEKIMKLTDSDFELVKQK